jgi:hypothetical protein
MDENDRFSKADAPPGGDTAEFQKTKIDGAALRRPITAKASIEPHPARERSAIALQKFGNLRTNEGYQGRLPVGICASTVPGP